MKKWVMQLSEGKKFHSKEIQKHCPTKGWTRGMFEKQEMGWGGSGRNKAEEVLFLSHQVVNWAFILREMGRHTRVLHKEVILPDFIF